MLTAETITALIERGAISWPGRLRGDGLLLHLGAPLQPLTAPVPSEVDLADQPSIDALYAPPVLDWDTFILAPGRLVLCQVAEALRLGAGFGGLIGTLSHLARLGLATHLASPLVLPGWEGHVTLELFNAGPAPLRLHRGMPAARMMLFRMRGPIRQEISGHPFYGHGTHLGSRFADEFFSVTVPGGGGAGYAERG